MFLESKSKFNWGRPGTTATCTFRPAVNPEDFARWSSSNMYRTSYNDMSVKVSITIHNINTFYK